MLKFIVMRVFRRINLFFPRIAFSARILSVIHSFKSRCMLCVCVKDVMEVVYSVCIVTRGAVGARVLEV